MKFILLATVYILINFILLFIMKYIPMNKENRKKIVSAYKVYYLGGATIWFCGFIGIELWIVKCMYNINYSFLNYLSQNEKFASYIALTLALLVSGPILILILKLIKKEQYLKQLKGQSEFKEFDKNNNMQSFYYELINIVKDVFKDAPYKVGIHIINAVLVVWINVSKCWGHETRITSTSLYMAIITFYAIEKVLTYFIENYGKLWKILDNKLFLTKEIDDGIHFGFSDLMMILDKLYEDYIETGRFEATEGIVDQYFNSKMSDNDIRVLSLNIDGGKEIIDNSLINYIDEIDADIIVLQEVKRRNILNKYLELPGYKRFLPTKYKDTEEDILSMNGKVGYTLLFAKNHIGELHRDDTNDSGSNRNRCYVKVENETISVLGVHILLEDQEKLITNIGESGCDIIAGDFNASIKKKETMNWKLLERLTRGNYDDLWQKGVRQQLAYYVDYKGEKILAGDEWHKTFVANTHIDYIMGKCDTIELEEIFIDMRTLVFTDHCAIVADLRKVV